MTNDAGTTGPRHRWRKIRCLECNYGTFETPGDRWFGSYHDRSPRAMNETRARQKADVHMTRPRMVIDDLSQWTSTRRLGK